MTTKKWFWIGLLMLWAHVVIAQDTCPAVVQQALAALDTQCSTTERNQACYGNVSLTAVPQSSATQFKFDSVGDIANLSDINSMKLEPLDTAKGTWGLVMMQVQADIPDTIPGQNVTFILFGDVTIENAAKEGQTPMQAFYLTTGIGDSKCAEAPESGLMVQTPSGVKDIAFNVNGVDVEMGSTVIFQAQRGQQMRVKTVEGKARLNINGESVAVVQGSEYSAPINDDLEVTGPGELAPYIPDEVEALPIKALDRKIDIAAPLTDAQIDDVKALEAANQPLCSDDIMSYLPPCTRPLVDINGDDVQYNDSGNVRLTDDEGNPLFYDDAGQPVTAMDDYYRNLSDWTGDKTLTDQNGNIIDVQDDGTLRIVDDQGRTFVVSLEGEYKAVDADGTTRKVDDIFADKAPDAIVTDEAGRPVDNGTLPTLDPNKRDPNAGVPTLDPNKGDPNAGVPTLDPNLRDPNAGVPTLDPNLPDPNAGVPNAGLPAPDPSATPR